ncbi:MAG: CinA family protein [bacterium]|nr:CinA family protein [bacterium]MDT8395825.1 CinA family protein [bacterium]
MKVQELCVRRGLTLAVAESCTGGLLGGSLTALPGSSGYFLGGIIAYSNRLKTDLLNVPADLLESEGAVSRSVAEIMAREVTVVTGADCGISVTGVAGPSGGTVDKPVGTVWIGIAVPAGTISRLYHFSGHRDEVREQAVAAALGLFLEIAGETV